MRILRRMAQSGHGLVTLAVALCGMVGVWCSSALGQGQPQDPTYRAAIAHLPEGTPDAYEAAYWENATVTPLQQAGFHVISASIVRVAAPDTAACFESDACIRSLAARLHTPTFFVVESRPSPSAQASFSVITVNASTIERGPPQPIRISDRLADEVQALGETVASSGRPCELVIDASAALTIDLNGERLADDMPTVFLPPGEHELQFAIPGRSPHREQVTCSTGERWQVKVQ